jgi:hypothetical protein
LAFEYTIKNELIVGVGAFKHMQQTFSISVQLSVSTIQAGSTVLVFHEA